MIKINKFPSLLERERITLLGQYTKLADGNHEPVLHLHEKIKKYFRKGSEFMYITHNIPFRISEFFADFVRGNSERLIFTAPDEASQKVIDESVYENDLKEKIFDFAFNQSEYGFTVLLGRLDEKGIFIIDEVQPDQYFPQSDGSVVFATYKYYQESELVMKIVLYTQHYQMIGGKCVIERAAYRVNDWGVATEIFSLEIMAQLLGFPIVPLETLDIDELPIRQVNNGRTGKTKFGQSDYQTITPNLAEINERTTHIAVELLTNLDSWITLPADLFNEDGKVKDEDRRAIKVDTKDSPVPQIIAKDNPLLVAAQEHIVKQLKTISFISSVPMFELLKEATPERVESLRIQMFAAIRKTQGKRSKMARGIKDMFRICGKLKGISSLAENDVDIHFEDVLPIDELTQIQVEAEKIRSGITSKKSSVMRVEGYDEDRADEELKSISEEERIAGVPPVDINNPPKI